MVVRGVDISGLEAGKRQRITELRGPPGGGVGPQGAVQRESARGQGWVPAQPLPVCLILGEALPLTLASVFLSVMGIITHTSQGCPVLMICA